MHQTGVAGRQAPSAKSCANVCGNPKWQTCKRQQQGNVWPNVFTKLLPGREQREVANQVEGGRWRRPLRALNYRSGTSMAEMRAGVRGQVKQFAGGKVNNSR